MDLVLPHRGGGALTHKHFQMIVKGNFIILEVLSKKIKVYLGWDASPMMGHAISCRMLRDEGLHIFLRHGGILLVKSILRSFIIMFWRMTSTTIK